MFGREGVCVYISACVCMSVDVRVWGVWMCVFV